MLLSWLNKHGYVTKQDVDSDLRSLQGLYATKLEVIAYLWFCRIASQPLTVLWSVYNPWNSTCLLYVGYFMDTAVNRESYPLQASDNGIAERDLHDRRISGFGRLSQLLIIAY